MLAAYAEQVAALKARGGYVTADVIDVTADTPNLDAMLAKFSREHWHDEDEVRFIIEGRGLFHIHARRRLRARSRPGRSDPRPARHASLVRSLRSRSASAPSGSSRIPPGWTPHYTDSGIDRGFQPLCFGPSYLGPTTQPHQ